MFVNRYGYDKAEGIYPTSVLSDVCRDAGLRKCDEERMSPSVEF